MDRRSLLKAGVATAVAGAYAWTAGTTPAAAGGSLGATSRPSTRSTR